MNNPKKSLIVFTLSFILLVPFKGFAEKEESPPPTLKQKVAVHLWGKTLRTGKSKKRYYPEVASPLLEKGKIFVGTHSSFFYALNAENGKVIWQFESNGPIASQPISNGSSVFFGNNKGTLYSLDAATGTLQWELFVGGEILSQPSLSGGDVFVVTTSREVSSVDATTGALHWSSYIKGFEKKITMRGHSPVVCVGDRLYVGFADGQVVSLSAANGSVLWSKNLAESEASFWDIDAAVLIDGGVLYVTGYFGLLAALHPNTGALSWSRDWQGGVDLASDGEFLYASSADGKVGAFNQKTGKNTWEISLKAQSVSAPYLINGYLVVGTDLNKVFIIDKKEGRLLQALSISGGYFGNAVGEGSRVFFLSGAGRIHALDLKLRND